MMLSAYNSDHFTYGKTSSEELTALEEAAQVSNRTPVQPSLSTYTVLHVISKYNLKICAVISIKSLIKKYLVEQFPKLLWAIFIINTWSDLNILALLLLSIFQ